MDLSFEFDDYTLTSTVVSSPSNRGYNNNNSEDDTLSLFGDDHLSYLDDLLLNDGDQPLGNDSYAPTDQHAVVPDIAQHNYPIIARDILHQHPPQRAVNDIDDHPSDQQAVIVDPIANNDEHPINQVQGIMNKCAEEGCNGRRRYKSDGLCAKCHKIRLVVDYDKGLQGDTGNTVPVAFQRDAFMGKLARGCQGNTHRGNQVLLGMAKTLVQENPNLDNKNLSKMLLQKFRDQRRRILYYVDGKGWFLCPDVVAKDRCDQMIRDNKKKNEN